MSKLIIHKVDETALRLRCEDHGILMEISEHFTFYVPGYKFMPIYKNKMWDGKCRLYNSKTSTLPYGLLFELLKFIKSRGYVAECHAEITETALPDRQSCIDYAKTLSLTASGQTIAPRDYQLDAYSHACSEGRSLIISPTGSGKSLIIYLCVRWFLHHYKQNVLIVVPTTSLVHQMTKDFADYTDHDSSFNVQDSAAMIMSGYDKNPQKDRIQLTMNDGSIRLYAPNDMVNTTGRGAVKAGDLTLNDDLT